MRVKTISRSKDDYLKQKEGDIEKVHHNIDEKYHPFQQQREVGIVIWLIIHFSMCVH